MTRRHVGGRRASALLAAAALAACATNPVSGKRELALVSEAQEIEMGRQGSAAVSAEIGLYPDPDLQAYVSRVGQGIAAKTERPGLPWEFHVVDDAALNAFALPGGFVFVTRGLLASLADEAQLASVLGHESGHVAARHSVQQMSRQQIASLGVGLGSVLSPVIAQYGQAAGIGLGMLFLKYSRDDERQADQLGFRYALADGYDARRMVGVFEALERAAELGAAGKLPEWQSTHPAPENRIAAVQGLIAATTESFASKRVGQAELLQQIDGMVYGADPRAGYFQGALFVHPGLAFQLRFPDGWSTQNTNEVVAAASPAQDAVIQLSIVSGTASEAAARFVGQTGVQATAPARRTIHDNPASTSDFTAPGERGQALRGVAAFIEYGGSTWALVAYGAADGFALHRPALDATIASFARLTDPAALAAKPMRLTIVKAPRAMSLEQLYAQTPSSIPLAEIAMINGLDPKAQLRAGQPVKRVTGTPVARTDARQ